MTDPDHRTDRLEERLREEAARFFRTLPKDPPTHRLLVLRRRQVRRRSAGGIGVLSITLAALALAVSVLRSSLTEGPVHHVRGGPDNSAAVEPDGTPIRAAEVGPAERRSAAEWQNDRPTYLIPIAVLEDLDALPEQTAAPIAAQPASWHELGPYERQAARELLRLEGGNCLTEAL